MIMVKMRVMEGNWLAVGDCGDVTRTQVRMRGD